MLNKHELLFVVDENNLPLEPKTREITHSLGYWHRTTHIWIYNTHRQILCQKRSLAKDIYPGMWDAFFGGHVMENQTYLESAIRELAEEIHISVIQKDLIFFSVHKSELVKEFQGIYYLAWNNSNQQIKIEQEEIDKIRWVDIDIVKENIFNKKNNWTKPEYASDMLEYVKIIKKG